MEHPVVRLAVQGDLTGLARLYSELRPNDPPIIGASSEALLGQLSENPAIRLVVCEAGGILVSTCMLGIVPNLAQGGKPFGIIEHVVTLAPHRRQGHSRRVLACALDFAWAANCYKVMLLSGAKLETGSRCVRVAWV